MRVELLAGLSEEDQVKRQQLLYACREALDVYREVLEARVKKAYEELTSKRLYDTPNWAYVQADLAGLTRAYREVIDLLTLDREE